MAMAGADTAPERNVDVEPIIREYNWADGHRKITDK